jgi:acyl transferase domain-containing protein/short-subunit dehydrogenase/acyl carrier protein
MEFTVLLDIVRAEALAVLRKVRPATGIDVDRPLRELGLDSLGLVELHARLSAALAVSLPVTIAFDQPTVTALAACLRREVLGLPEEQPLSSPSTVDEPVVVVGMGCRLPGGVSSPEDLWDLVIHGRSAITGLPDDRGWAPSPHHGGFLADATRFDADFFGISPREALAMEPQQRVLLETAWEAFERAGIDPTSLRGSQTGVFVGAGANQYHGLDGHRLTGTSLSIASGRVAYFLGLQGPALTLDTACSSSLVALHLAAESVRRGESSLALAGGVTVLGSPSLWTEFSQLGGLAPDGKIKAFAASADGTNFAEGVALLVIERLSDARRHGHPVLAVLRSSAINQDGASNGLTAPSGPAQRRLIKIALAAAGLTADDVDVVEAHGTGTSLGDPVEAQAILATYGQDRSAPLWLGSVKSNIGHTQAAAGVAGVIKMIMAMRHGTLPRTLHVDSPSPNVDWSAGQVRLLTETVPWGGHPRRAGISGFGISGTNAHVIIEEPPAEEIAERPTVAHPIPLVISAKSLTALRLQTENVMSLVDSGDVSLVDLGYSLAVGRAALDERAVIIAAGHPGEPVRGTVTGGRVAFLFPGEGRERLGMGRELYGRYPVFAQAMDQAVGCLDMQLDRTLWDALFSAEPELLAQPGYGRAAMFAIEVALFRLLESWGLRPDFLAGDSVGEFAAAHAAGVLSLEDAALLVGARDEDLRRLSQVVTYFPPRIPIVPGQLELRDGMRWLADQGVDTFLELGPDPLLADLVPEGAVVSSVLRYDRPEPQALLTAVAEAYVRGAKLDWEAFYEGLHARRIPLPTYPFQRERFWLSPPAAGPAGHPMLGTVVPLAGSDGLVLTGRISLSSHPWLADHVISGMVLLPGAAFVEFALQAGLEAGYPVLDELTIESPLVLPDSSDVALQVVVRDRTIEVHARTDDEPWVRHAHGLLSAEPVSGAELTEWPPRGAEPVDLSGFYAAVEHGPAFHGLRAAWRRAGEVFAEVSLSDPGDAGEFGIHPALLDAAMHALDLAAGEDLGVPCAWHGVALHSRGASSVRVRVGRDGKEQMSVSLVDSAGVRVASMRSVLFRPVERMRESLYGLRWTPAATPAASTAGNGMYVVPSMPAGDVPGAVRMVTLEVLAMLQAWLTDEHPADSRLVIVTQHAIAVRPGEDVDLVQASVPGLVRSAQAEHPGRFVLVDVDELTEIVALADAVGEPELAVRDGRFLIPRLARIPVGKTAESPWHPDSRVLITGGTGALGAHVARHLVQAHGVEHLVLASRRGPAAPGVDDLVAELGIEVAVVACDVADRAAVAALLAEHPVNAVVHAAGVLSDGVLDSLTPEQFDVVMRPKIDGAWHLHELAGDLSAFVLHSSMAAIVDGAGQGNYAAANAFLDGLAAHRRASGQVATSLAWGPWPGGMNEQPDVRARRLGIEELSIEENLHLFDKALLSGNATVVPTRFRRVPAEPSVARAPLDLVRAEAAAVLGYPDASRIGPAKAFHDLGFDSLTALELRNRLSTATGLRLPATLTYDHPTPQALADYLATRSEGVPQPRAGEARDEPMAIIGMACRYPGDIQSPEDLWQVVASGEDVISQFPADRGWELSGEGGFLHGAAEFDAEFFGIPPREAAAMDPQQRLLLEISWETFERAGIDPQALRGSDTGIFAGVMYHDYGDGNAGSMVSGRVAYTFGLQGPAITVDTACSSSLVAMHWAIQALRAGECSLALAGGVTVMSTPDTFTGMDRQGGLAADGRCKSFGAGADGTGWAEGVGMVLLERLSDAHRNGHRILGIVRGSAVNSDGASNGLTAPSGPAQQRVIRQALASAGLTPSDVDVVEGHGTGTALGDPIEAQAIIRTYGQNRDVPLWLGSVKSNLGHTQAAAGIAGVLKMIMAMRYGVVPLSLHASEPSQQVDWTAGNVRLAADTTDWPETGRPRRAGVSSFGISGTNAHVIIEQAPQSEIVPEYPPDASVLPWVISGATPEALADQAARLRDTVDTLRDEDFARIGRTLATARAAFDHRAVIIGSRRAEFTEGLEAVRSGAPAIAELATEGETAFLFTGQGAQRLGMGRELYGTFPAFAEAFDAAVGELDRQSDLPLREVMWGENPELAEQTVAAQAALFAFEVALARLLESWGVQPAFVSGHSAGEIAAAHIAGILSLSDAATMVAARGRLMQALPPGGAMIAVHATEAEVRPLLTGDISIAAVNGPHSVVLSGAEATVTKLAERFAMQGRKTSRLRVSHAFHSVLMDPMLDEFRGIASALSYHEPKIPLVSNGSIVGLTDAEYWVRHARDAVRFADSVSFLEDRGVRTFLEIGPDAVLTAMGGDGFIPLTRAGRSEERVLIAGLSRAYARGTRVTWAKFFGHGQLVDLPTYAFQHQRFWINARRPADAGFEVVDHPILSAAMVSPESGEVVLSGRLTQPWLADHKVLGATILPGAAMIELAIRAGDQAGCDFLAELTLETPLLLDNGPVAVQVVVGADEAGRRPVKIYSRVDDQPWVRHAAGFLASGSAELMVSLAEWPPPGAVPMDLDHAYDRLREQGYEYGTAFQGMRAAWLRGDELFAEVELPGHVEDEGYGIHPALLDAAMHADLLVDNEVLLPFAWTGVSLHATGVRAVRVWVRRIRGAEESEMMIADDTGQPVMSVASLISRAVSSEQLGAAWGATPDSLLRIEWVPVTGPRIAGDSVILGTPLLSELLALEIVPPVVIAQCPGLSGNIPYTARALTAEVLELIQAWLAGDRFEASKLVVVTNNAMSDDPDVVQAPVWGLVRAAQAEHPGRIGLVDWDGVDDAALLAAAASDEPELAVRGDELSTPRLARVPGRSGGPVWDPSGTVLITGGTSGLGALIAEHLVAEHGIRHLLLVSRSGGTAPDLAAEVTVKACDVTDRDALARLLAEIPADRPLTGVVHAAAVVDGGVVGSMTSARLGTVMRPKVDAAWHLHELTMALDLSAFVLMSSAGGLVIPGGQANYAAASTFLNALAEHRKSMGLPATALAFGMWTGQSERMTRLGLPAMSAGQGLALFDAALRTDEAVLIPLRIDHGAMVEVPPLLRGLVRPPVRREPDLARKVLGRTSGERDRILLELVTRHVAAVLGHEPSAIAPDRVFQDLGFDSLAAIELRNALNSATGLNLPVTLVFDHQSPRAVAQLLKTELTGGSPVAAGIQSVPAVAGEPVAIVGMSCRFPGGVRSPEDLWDLVAEGQDAISGFPADRGWDMTGGGGFLHDAAEFDPAFFGISPDEAMAMDPQQRLLLETAWEAFERAGIDPTSMRGTQTGVYAGVMYHEYGSGTRVPDEITAYLGNGSAGSVVSGRVAYTFGLEGPAVTVDTACSSSLVALHMACQALRAGEVSMALAGGVTVMPTPEIFAEFGQQGALAGDGRCKAFSAAADGTGWSEGVGLLLVERLSDARRNGHEVLAVLRGSAINQDGASNGLTAPNGQAQQRVILKALAAAGLRPSDVDVIEGHGTGTTLGDPIEAQAILQTYGQNRAEPVWLGSVKSNIGHAQAAAGVSGVIKMVMAIRHGLMPQTLHVDAPSPEVDWSAGAVRLLTSAREWPKTGPRRAAVSSFGLSGTNAHVIIEQAPPVHTMDTRPAGCVVPVLISAADEFSLRKQAERLREHLEADPGLSVLDLAYSLATSRAALAHRAVIPAKDRDVVLRCLTALAEGRSAGAVRGKPGGLTAFLFTGQGAQRMGMGRELYGRFPAFAEAFDVVTAELDKHLDLPLAEVLWGESENMVNQTVFAQAGLFAVEVALYRLFESCGIQPDFLAGHSIGELSAAYVAGVWSLADAARLVAARGTLMQALPGGGAMVAIQATEQEIQPMLSARVALAAVNGPASVVISGDEEAVTELAQHFADQDRRATRLRVSHAFHSHLMEPMLAPFREIAESLVYTEPQIPVVSTVTGEPASDLCSPGYWVRQVRSAVRFAAGIDCLSAAGVTQFVELGPDGVLSGLVPGAVAVMRKGREEVATLVTALAHLQVSGTNPDWHAYFTGFGARRIDLPTYAFQRRRFWLNVPMTAEAPADAGDLGQVPARHPLLSAVVPSAESGAPMLTGRLSLGSHPWLADHTILGRVTLPGAAYVEMALRAGQEVGCDVLDELIQQVPLEIPEDCGVAVQVVLGAEEDGRYPVKIYSRIGDEPWVCNGRGILSSQPVQPTVTLRAWPPAGAKSVDISGLYEDLASLGYGYGPMFRGVRAAWRRGEDIFADVRLAGADASFGLHPALLDAALHAERFLDSSDRTALPFAWTGVSLHAAGASALRVRLSKPGPDLVSVTIADPTGQPVATIESLRLREISPGRRAQNDSLYRIAWHPISVLAGAEVQITQVTTAVTDTLPAVRALSEHVLTAIREWLATESAAPLAIVTRNAVLADPADTVDLRQAPVWGLVRAAQAEHPGRFVLADLDDSEESSRILAAAVASGEPEIAIRQGVVTVPRLAKAIGTSGELPWDADGTVMITGGTGLLGSLTALHLVAEHGVRHLILTGRRGVDAPGAAELRDSLTAMGAEVWIPAVDMSDRCAVAEILAEIPSAHPLTAVVHAAGVMDNGLVSALTPEQVDRVLAAKADAAWHLHELTQHLNLAAFVMYSSAGGLVLAAGQANYAAANVFLDALAHHRRAAGLAATSLAWGPWEGISQDGHLDLRRMDRAGLPILPFEDGLTLFDAAMRSGDAVLVPVNVNQAVLRTRQDELPALLRGLGRAAGKPTVRRDLAHLSELERGRFMLDLVRAQVAAVLGQDTLVVEPLRGFTDLGMDSLAAIELRNRLQTATGLRLPATVMFDHPNSVDLAGFLMAALAPDPAPDDGEIRARLATISLDRMREAGILEMLMEMADLSVPVLAESEVDRLAAIESMAVDELVRAVLESDEEEGER